MEIMTKEAEKTETPFDEEAMIEPTHVDADKSHPMWKEVRDAMRDIYDPEIPVNVYELGLIYAVKFLEQDGGTYDLDVKMTLTSPGCPVAQEMPGWVQSALLPLKGVGDVDVEIIWDPPWDPSIMSETAKMQLNMFY